MKFHNPHNIWQYGNKVWEFGIYKFYSLFLFNDTVLHIVCLKFVSIL